ncbi:hypothetical protein EDB85DRAFT_1884811 [Lactarius pseudohatsudake]|nr:hypothetical protein EDB85DRAFT_1884811 [Lactarius pseudohatsudake]
MLVRVNIRVQEFTITGPKWGTKSEGMDDPMSVKMCKKAELDLQEAPRELVWAPPIVFSMEPGQYTHDHAVIKIDVGKLNASNCKNQPKLVSSEGCLGFELHSNYCGNSVNIRVKYMHKQFMDKV